MRNKILAALLAVALMTVFFNINVCADEKHAVFIETMTVSDTGELEIIGYITNAEVGSQVACLITREGALTESGVGNLSDIEDIAWIDQVQTGNNGIFLIQGFIREEFSNEELYVAIGSAYLDKSPYIAKMPIPELKARIEAVNNNSVLYGRDVYYIQSNRYTPDNIADSFAYGGNNIYYKIGGLWYNLLDDGAVDNSFLTKENATDIEKIRELKPRYYYGLTEIFEFE